MRSYGLGVDVLVGLRAAAWVRGRCSRGNGRCNCGNDDTRCEAIKPFFEQATEPTGCASFSAEQCGNNYGYKSCYPKPDGSCWADPCWMWAVDVMATCPEFYPDLSEELLPTYE